MKIKYIITKNVGPLEGHQVIDLTDDWRGEVAEQVLFSGPNGSGKSTLLKMIAMLWESLGQWLDYEGPLSRGPVRDWLKQWGGCAVVFEGLSKSMNGAPSLFGLFFGQEEKWKDQLRKDYPAVTWIGGMLSSDESENQLTFGSTNWARSWGIERKRLILGEPAQTPNLIYLDAEERRWVKPRENVGKPLADNPAKRWMPTYRVTDDWQGQLESSLINLKIIDQKRFEDAVTDLNAFLVNKEIAKNVREGDRNRLRVIKKGRPDVLHTLDELSSGEHQVLILIFTISRWLEKGGIVLIDEPDMHMHPSLIPGLLGQIEAMVAERGGQLLITSHIPDIWNRYDAFGKRIKLGG